VMRIGSAPPSSVFDRVRVEEISKSAIFSKDAVSMQEGNITITEDLRKLLANSATDAYLSTAMVSPAKSRKKAFERALENKLSHVAAPEITPDRQVVLYKGVQAVIDPTNLFNKIDARREYTMSVQGR
jgi:hypothetical protein